MTTVTKELTNEPLHEIYASPAPGASLQVFLNEQNQNFRNAGFARYHLENSYNHDLLHQLAKSLRIFPFDHINVIERIIGLSNSHEPVKYKLQFVLGDINDHNSSPYIKTEHAIKDIANLILIEPHKYSYIHKSILNFLHEKNDLDFLDTWNNVRYESTKTNIPFDTEEVANVKDQFKNLAREFIDKYPEKATEVLLKTYYIRNEMYLNPNQAVEINSVFNFLQNNCLGKYSFKQELSSLVYSGSSIDSDSYQVIKQTGRIGNMSLQEIELNHPEILAGMNVIKRFSARNMVLSGYNPNEICTYLNLNSEEYALFTQGLLDLELDTQSFANAVEDKYFKLKATQS